MMGKYKRQSGFGVIEVLLILIAVCTVGFVGWYAYSSQIKKDKSASTGASTTSDPRENKTETRSSESATKFGLPDAWKWYENASQEVKIAYPKNWDTSLGFSNNLAVNATLYL
jgi:hypothetical protein